MTREKEDHQYGFGRRATLDGNQIIHVPTATLDAIRDWLETRGFVLRQTGLWTWVALPVPARQAPPPSVTSGLESGLGSYQLWYDTEVENTSGDD